MEARKNNAFDDLVEMLPEKWQGFAYLAAIGVVFGLPIAGVIWLMTGPHNCAAAKAAASRTAGEAATSPSLTTYRDNHAAEDKVYELCRKKSS